MRYRDIINFAKNFKTRRSRNIDLYILGTGIRGFHQVTMETLDVLCNCRIILHLSDQHRTLKRINPNTVNLDRYYWTGDERGLVYQRIVDLVVMEVYKGPRVALVSYGHPGFFDDVCVELRRLLRRQKKSCVVLPGISSLDTLCIDLDIDYGDGLQVFDATELVEYRHRINPTMHTLVFQVFDFGSDVTPDAVVEKKGRLVPLEKYLIRYYPSDHRAIFIYTDDGTSEGRISITTTISKLDTKRKRLFPGITLYVPPIS